MPDLLDGQTAEVQGSAKLPYVIKNVGGVFSCSCIAWRNQSLPIDRRTCKHLKKYRGEAVELARIGQSQTKSEANKTVEPDDSKEVAPVLLAHSWDMETDILGWWMSEKLDGVRAYWTGEKFISRLGNEFYAPDWFTAGLPNFKLDGELWMGRKRFDEASGICRRQNGGDLWKEMRYKIFDAPEIAGKFENRVDFYTRHFENNPFQYVETMRHEQCRGVAHLKEELKRIESLGGEGLMLREPGSLYEVGRSYTLLKVKSMYDAEAIVVRYEAGKGKHKGKMGAIWAKFPNGVEFKIGTGFSDAVRANPPKIGSTITFQYTELLKSGKPRFSGYLREKVEH